jgi:hypothetical protein
MGSFRVLEISVVLEVFYISHRIIISNLKQVLGLDQIIQQN